MWDSVGHAQIEKCRAACACMRNSWQNHSLVEAFGVEVKGVAAATQYPLMSKCRRLFIFSLNGEKGGAFGLFQRIESQRRMQPAYV